MVQFNVARGTKDFLPEEMAKRKVVEETIKKTFEEFAFQRIQTPTFEEFKLFSARSGPEIREGMFTFFCDNEEFALRPELTAAVCRLVTTGKITLPKPYELYYIGQCFRYERPQSGRYREFTQAGVELLGTSSPIADAKVIAVATKVLQKLEIVDYKLKIGNIGIYRELLKENGFDFDKQCLIIGSINRMLDSLEKLEVISKKKELTHADKEFLITKMGEVYKLQNEIKYAGEYEIFPTQIESLDSNKIKELFKLIPLALQETTKFVLIKKYELSNELVSLIFEVAKLKGRRDEIEEKSKILLKGSIAENSLNNLLEVLNWLESYGVKNYTMVLGVARGLDFYTGTVFEFDIPILDAQKQVCGGGRYDKLIEEFGGQPTPATGFAFGFDRLVEALSRMGKLNNGKKAEFFIANADKESKIKSIQICQNLRDKGITCAEDLNSLDLKNQTEYAKKLGIKKIITLGKKEIESGLVTLSNLETKERKQLKLEEIKSED
jgi:histidyl-tRNA synthetase